MVDILNGHDGAVCCLEGNEDRECLFSGGDYGDGWIGVWVVSKVDSRWVFKKWLVNDGNAVV